MYKKIIEFINTKRGIIAGLYIGVIISAIGIAFLKGTAGKNDGLKIAASIIGIIAGVLIIRWEIRKYKWLQNHR